MLLILLKEILHRDGTRLFLFKPEPDTPKPEPEKKKYKEKKRENYILIFQIFIIINKFYYIF